jgi:hypothetical protein
LWKNSSNAGPLIIGQLGAIAVIRTFLNHFLEEDLERCKVAGEREVPPGRAA